ncbi:hypothetical protein LL912_18135 [Niabella sp. CC-SYL272]|uniref:hypothetical protein n=1 Tax=Niabella agricola TaxID=2891571 RepID=UPI001F1E6860|nr:hypothetical protein [Niabella agricola]MCF3110708.1 hypothetical protein [Niabella agricola]
MTTGGVGIKNNPVGIKPAGCVFTIDTFAFYDESVFYFPMIQPFRKCICLVLLLMVTVKVRAYSYGEHKEIGDQAFALFLKQYGFQPNDSLLRYYWGLTGDEKNGLFFPELSGGDELRVTYGMLNALSGDHERDPLLLEEQLRNRNSVIRKIAALHQRYLLMGYAAAPDGKLTRVDLRYALLAAVNLSHFYEYRKTFQQQLRHFNKTFIRDCQDPTAVPAAFKKLGKTNALTMYVSLHTLALDLAEQGGLLARNGNGDGARKLLLYALLFNGFADHFLEDAFAAGHLVVNRSILATITNNKALHDFYSEHGCTVVNSLGERWQAHGDGQFNRTHHHWQNETTLGTIRYERYTPEAHRIIEAVRLSLNDVANAFYTAYRSERFTPFLQEIPDHPRMQPVFFLERLAALRLVPLPYGSDLSTLPQAASLLTPENKRAIQPLQHRNFIRNRVANSFIITTTGAFADHQLKGIGFRFNAVNFSRKFEYNTSGTKKGMLDYWHGYTISYDLLDIKPAPESSVYQRAQLLKAGIRSNFDYWVSNRKFIGLYSYMEAGMQFSGGSTSFVFVPSAGIQFASLFNLNYYNMPVWARVPLQYLLPLKFRTGSIIAPRNKPRFFSSLDLDLFF